MSHKTLLEQSIDKRLEEERYVIPKEKKKGKTFNLQAIMIASILIGLIFSIIRLIPYFLK